MKTPKPSVKFDKWVDPLGRFLDDEQEFERRQDYKPEDFEERIAEPTLKPMFVATQYGLIPVNSSNNPAKFFQWWVGHTNFPIMKSMKEGMDFVLGVESLDFYSSYRFKVGVAKNFDEDEVLDALESFMISKIKEPKKEEVGV